MITAARKESYREKAAGLSLSDFSQLFSRLSHQHFPRGHFIYQAGDDGDAMYFINSGKVEILTKKGHLVSILRHGDFFGEGSLLEQRNKRFTAAKCQTPVDVIKVSREEFERYVASSSETKRTLKLKWKARTLAQAKQLIRLQTNLTKKTLKEGDVVYNEGDIGESMYEVIEGTFEVRHGGKPVHFINSGDSFGESSLLFRRPRSSTVVCASPECQLHEMKGSDFYAMLESDPSTTNALRDMCRKRLFQKAVRHHAEELSKEELTKVFHAFNKDKSGALSLSEVKSLMKQVSLPECEVGELLKSLDLDEDGKVTMDEFQRVFKQI
jgi:CRP-like cAMP-binding protein